MNSANNNTSDKQTERKRLGFVFFVACAVATSFVGCKEVHFPEPQPHGIPSLARIPVRMQGRYLFSKDSGEVDTLTITQNAFNFKDSVENPLILSDSLVLKTYKGYYFFNMQSDDSVKTWMLYVLRQRKNGDLTLMGMDDKNFEELLVKLSKEIRIDSVDHGKGMTYSINPTPKQLIKLIEKKIFVKIVECKKMK